MSETAISWTVSNWITVFLMVLLGSAIVAAAGAGITRIRAARSE